MGPPTDPGSSRMDNTTTPSSQEKQILATAPPDFKKWYDTLSDLEKAAYMQLYEPVQRSFFKVSDAVRGMWIKKAMAHKDIESEGETVCYPPLSIIPRLPP